MNTTQNFKDTIKKFLDKKAGDDSLFASSYAKQGKNIDDCINYILNEVQKSRCNGFTDEEIFGMALHYYDEDNIQVNKGINCNRIVVNHTVNLSDEEIKEARNNAMKRIENEQYDLLKKKAPKPKKELEVQQQSLF